MTLDQCEEFLMSRALMASAEGVPEAVSQFHNVLSWFKVMREIYESTEIPKCT